MPDAPVLIGTEAVLHRVRRAAAVAFLDIDLHLLAPRFSATEETLALFVRAGPAGRWPRDAGRAWARCWCRPGCPTTRCSRRSRWATRRPVLARGGGDPPRRRACPPSRRWPLVSGALAPAYAEALRRSSSPPAPGRRGRPPPWRSSPLGRRIGSSLRAPTHDPLCDLLARTPRPAGRGLRVEVDPVAL